MRPPPPVDGWPPWSRDRQAVPPQPPESSTGHQKEKAGSPPPLPPSPLCPPQSTNSQRPARGTAAPHPARRARGGPHPTRGLRQPGRGATATVHAAVRRMPPVSRPPTPTVAAAGQQPWACAQRHSADRIRAAARGRKPVQCGVQDKDRAARLDARPGGGGEAD